MSFHALDAAHDLVRAIRAPLHAVRSAHAPLADQLLRAVECIPLNIAEGSALTPKSAAHHYRIAAGSTREVDSALRTAEGLGFVDEVGIRPALELCDRLGAMLWRLSRR